jgi:putative restriction endonuclease
MHAYGTRCAVCSLTQGALLDAAHIIADGQPGGDPVTPNGLSLCKIHHAAYDEHILGITPERIVRINSDVLQEVDGPMLRHGLQEFHGAQLRVVPTRRSDQPDPDRLAARFEDFLRAG